MAGRERLGHLSDREYEAVRSALMATAKGRAFLQEFAERARPDDTRALLLALRRMEESLALIRENLQPGTIAGTLRRIGERLSDLLNHGEVRSGGGSISISRQDIETIQNEINMLSSALESESEIRTQRSEMSPYRDPTPDDTA